MDKERAIAIIVNLVRELGAGGEIDAAKLFSVFHQRQKVTARSVLGNDYISNVLPECDQLVIRQVQGRGALFSIKPSKPPPPPATKKTSLATNSDIKVGTRSAMKRVSNFLEELGGGPLDVVDFASEFYKKMGKPLRDVVGTPVLGQLKKHSYRFHIVDVGDNMLTISLAGKAVPVTATGKSKPAPAPLAREVQVVSNVNECKTVCNRILEHETAVIALDCEGIDLGRPGGKLCLVQLAASSADRTVLFDAAATIEPAILFDVAACPQLFDAGLRDLLESTDLVKVVHDCRADTYALLQHQVRLQGVFDSQLAYQVVTNRDPQRPISLSHLLEETTGAEHPEKARPPHKEDRQFWQKRPLSQRAKSYAAADVELLLAAVNKLYSTRFHDPMKQLDQVNRLSEGRLFAVPGHAQPVRDQPCPLSVDEQFDLLLHALSERVVTLLQANVTDPRRTLVDVVLDLGRPVVFILTGDEPAVHLDECLVEQSDIEHVLAKCGAITDANRACVGRSLHRCSVIREPDANGTITGLTVRVARVVGGVAGALADVLAASKSVLLVGPPGRGKTTLLRDVACLLASPEHSNRVMIVDTSNEIAGEALGAPHTAVGRARRMKVGLRARQYEVMLEAVQNHTPEALVIDEIGTSQEVEQAVSIRQRGIQLIATTHGRTLVDVIRNPATRNLLGGVNTTILSAMEKEREGAAAKTRLERKTPPAFDVCIELLAIHRWRVHHDVAAAVDAVLRDMGETVTCELRTLQLPEGADADPSGAVLHRTFQQFPGGEEDSNFVI